MKPVRASGAVRVVREPRQEQTGAIDHPLKGLTVCSSPPDPGGEFLHPLKSRAAKTHLPKAVACSPLREGDFSETPTLAGSAQA